MATHRSTLYLCPNIDIFSRITIGFNMAQVKLDNVTKIYEGGITAVRDVNLTIHDKEFVVLVGPSGCGKSTALRMIAGLEEITQGTISIDGKVVNDVPPKDRDIAMVFQNYALYPHMSVFENLAFGLKMRRYPKNEIEQRVTEAADILGIKDYLSRKPKALSGGQRQRVALGRAMVRRPKAFLFDEPLSNLDANLRVQMRTEISRLHKKLETTMIYVTHDQVEAMSMGDRIVVMKDGIVHQIDTPLTIYHKPANKFVASFIGSPTMNFFEGRLVRDGELVFDDLSRSLRLPIPPSDHDRLSRFVEKELTLGIRPENISAQTQSSTARKVTVQITVTEPVGNEIFVYFTLPPSEILYVARISAELRPTAGTSFDLYFEARKLHFFDRTTGKAL